jgi:hypothetical protein
VNSREAFFVPHEESQPGISAIAKPWARGRGWGLPLEETSMGGPDSHGHSLGIFPQFGMTYTDLGKAPSGSPRSDAQVCCARPTQVLVFYGIKELMIENSSKVKMRKGLFAKK